jgi:tRNA A37 methylthiotransferase MiaB
MVEYPAGPDARTVYARNDGNRVVALPPAQYRPGEFLRVRITDASPHQLKGEPAEAMPAANQA